MKDQHKTKAQLVAELQALRQQLSNSNSQKGAETLLLDTEIEKQTILDSLLEFVVYLDKNMKIIWANKAASDSVGKSLNGMVGCHCHEEWENKNEPCPDCPVVKAMQTKKASTIEKTTSDGRHWLIRGYPVLDDTGNIQGAIEVVLEITDKKKAEKEAKATEARFKSLIETRGESIWSIDTKYCYQVFNDFFKKDYLAAYGVNLETGMNALDILPPDLRKVWKAKYDKAFTGKKEFFEFSENVHGKKEYFLVLLNPILVENRVTGVSAISINTTKQKEIENELRRSTNFINSLLKAIPMAIFYKDREGRYQGCNKAFTEILGVTASEIKGKTVHELWPSDMAETYHKKDLELMDKPDQQVYEFKIEDKKGIERPVIFTKNVFYDEEEKVAGLVGAFLDITEIKKMQDALRASEEKFAKAFRNSPDAITLTSLKDDHLVDVNDKTCQITGYTRKELIGKRALDLDLWVKPADRKRYYNELKQTGRVTDLQADFCMKSGKIRTGLVSGEIISLSDGKYLLGTIRDITEMKMTEKSRDEAYKIINRSPVVVFLWQNVENWPVEFVTDNVKEIIGYSSQHFLNGKIKYGDIIHPEDLDKVSNEVTTFSAKKGCNEFVHEPYRIISKNKKTIWIDDRTYIRRNENGEITHYQGIILDITERKQAELALLQLSKGQATLLEISKSLTSSMEIHTVLQNMIDRTTQLSGLDTGAIYTVQGNEIILGATTPPLPKDFPDEIRRTKISDHPNINKAFKNRRPHFLFDLDKVKLSPAEQVVKESRQLRALLYVPLSIKKRIVGVLILGSTKETTLFSKNEINLFSSISNQVALAIENARLFDETKKYVHELEQNISERKKVTDALRQSEEKYKRFVETTPDAIVVTELEGNVIYANQEFAHIHKLDSPQEWYGKNAFELISSEDHEKAKSTINEMLKKGIVNNIELTLLRKDQNRFPAEISGNIIRNADGSPQSLLLLSSDITKRKELEKELQQYRQRLERLVEARTSELQSANKELEAFSYSVSHDLRAPLRHISGYVDLLNRRYNDALPDKAQQYLNNITDSVSQMGILIDDLLNFSRTSRQEMHSSIIDTNKLVKDAIKTLKADKKGHIIDWKISSLPKIFGDYLLLKVVWINLLSNSIKFSQKKKKTIIEIGHNFEDQEDVFYVKDNGAGFDMQFSHKLFGVFQRLHSSQEFEGTGIGLANVHRIIMRHGGRIWAEAKIKKGATFYFSIPKIEGNKL